MSEQFKQDLDLIQKHCAASLCPEHFEAWERIADALNSVEGVATQPNAQAGVVEVCEAVITDLENAAAIMATKLGQPDRWWSRERATRLRAALAAIKGVES